MTRHTIYQGEDLEGGKQALLEDLKAYRAFLLLQGVPREVLNCDYEAWSVPDIFEYLSTMHRAVKAIPGITTRVYRWVCHTRKHEHLIHLTRTVVDP